MKKIAILGCENSHAAGFLLYIKDMFYKLFCAFMVNNYGILTKKYCNNECFVL